MVAGIAVSLTTLMTLTTTLAMTSISVTGDVAVAIQVSMGMTGTYKCDYSSNDNRIYNSIANLAIEDVFRVYIASSKHEGELGEFETVMQTRDAVEGLHNCREFPTYPSV